MVALFHQWITFIWFWFVPSRGSHSFKVRPQNLLGLFRNLSLGRYQHRALPFWASNYRKNKRGALKRSDEFIFISAVHYKSHGLFCNLIGFLRWESQPDDQAIE